MTRNILYNYKIFNLGIDFTTKLIVNPIYNSILNVTELVQAGCITLNRVVTSKAMYR